MSFSEAKSEETSTKKYLKNNVNLLKYDVKNILFRKKNFSENDTDASFQEQRKLTVHLISCYLASLSRIHTKTAEK